MVDPDERESEALTAGLKAMAELLAEIGWERRLREISAQQARTMVEVAVGGFLKSTQDSAPEAPF